MFFVPVTPKSLQHQTVELDLDRRVHSLPFTTSEELHGLQELLLDLELRFLRQFRIACIAFAQETRKNEQEHGRDITNSHEHATPLRQRNVQTLLHWHPDFSKIFPNSLSSLLI